MGIRVSHEGKRGCGFRKPGGLYLVAPRPTESCLLLPVETSVCPTCGTGIKPARGFTWWYIDPFLDEHYVKSGGAEVLFPQGHHRLAAMRERATTDAVREHGTLEHTLACPLSRNLGRVGLIWIGEVHYPTPDDFMREAAQMGISRRIAAVPREFKVGQTWVMLGHRKAIGDGYMLKGGGTHYTTLDELRLHEGEADVTDIKPAFKPGIITAFKPTAVEYVVRPEDEGDEEFLDSLRERGIEPVKVVPVYEEEALEV